MEPNVFDRPLCNCVSEIVTKFTLNAELGQENLIKAAQYFAELSAVNHSCNEANEFTHLADNDVWHYINEYNALPFVEYEDNRKERLQFWKHEYQKVEKMIKGSTGKLKKISAQNYWRFYNSRLHINLLYRIDFGKPESQIEIFIKEIQRISATDFPFKDSFVFDSEINLHLFSEFTKTDRKPNFIKFVSLFITDKEHQYGCLYGGTAYQARHNGISELFSRGVQNSVLPQSLYTNDLKLTPTVNASKLIAERLSVLRKSVFDPQLDKYKEVEMEAEYVIRLLNSLDSLVRSAIINEVVNDNSNVLLFLEGKGVTVPDRAYEDLWDDIKGKFNSLLHKQYQSISRGADLQKGKSKLKFTYDNLKPIVLELANLKGYQKPSVFLDELKEEVEAFNLLEFKGNFYLNIHYLCKENASLFWSESHRKDITAWLHRSGLGFDVFNTTWQHYEFRLPTNSKAAGIVLDEHLITLKEFTFSNNFDNVPCDILYDYFKKALVDTQMLTFSVLNEFVQAAFDYKTPPIIKFRFDNMPLKRRVMKVFYVYYKDIAGKPFRKQAGYAGLLGDYFEGYVTNTVKTNFNKAV